MAEVVAENLASNPSFETASGEVVVRENLNSNPSARTDTAEYSIQPGTGGVGTVSRVSGETPLEGVDSYVRTTWSTVPTGGNWRLSCPRFTVDPAKVYSIGYYVRGRNSGEYQLAWDWYGDSGWISADSVTMTLNWQSGSATPWGLFKAENLTPPTGATLLRVYVGRRTLDSVVTSGFFVDAVGGLYEQAPTLGPYFDKDSPASGDFTYRERPGGGAQEVAQGVAETPTLSGAVGGIAWSSVDGPHHGSRFARCRVDGSVATGILLQDVSILQGAQYTMKLWARAVTRDTKLKPRIGNKLSSEITLPKGEWREIVITATSANSYNTGLLLEEKAGHQPGDIIDIDEHILVEGTYDGPYFDGDTQNTATYKYAWTGAPNASTSTKSLVTASDFNLPPGENIRSTLSRYIWFGNQRVQQWLPMPSSGTQASYEYAVGGGGLANGGFHARRSSGFHKTYQFDFAVREADQWNGIEGYNRFASGIDSGIISSGGGTGSGIGEGVLFRFCDPMIMGRNMFTPQWAAPQLCNEFEGEGFHDIAPVRGGTYVTPQNTRHYPATAPYWDLTASDSASVSRQPEDGPRHTFKLLIPPTHMLYLGFVGVVTGAGAIFVEKRFRDGTYQVETITELIDPTSGDGLGSLMVDGSEVAYVTMWLGSTSPGSAAQVALVASTAIELPYWETPDMSTGGWWTEGLGHSGLEFGDGAFVETYEVAVQGGRGRYLKGMSTSLVEVGAWR